MLCFLQKKLQCSFSVKYIRLLLRKGQGMWMGRKGPGLKSSSVPQAGEGLLPCAEAGMSHAPYGGVTGALQGCHTHGQDHPAQGSQSSAQPVPSHRAGLSAVMRRKDLTSSQASLTGDQLLSSCRPCLSDCSLLTPPFTWSLIRRGFPPAPSICVLAFQ